MDNNYMFEKNNNKKNIDSNYAIRASYLTIILNFALSLLKFIAGIVGKSTAVVTDAIHSASDVISTVIVIIGIKISQKKSDENHPYGHERYECVAAIILSMMLIFTGGSIGYSSIKAILDKSWTSYLPPGMITVVVTVVSILVKEAMYWYTRYVAKKTDSTGLMADAWHHRSDAMSSVGALIGILFARHGFLFMDDVAGIIICLFILKVSLDIFIEAINKMVDKACPIEFDNEIKDIITSHKEVYNVDKFQTRSFGNRIFVDVEISLDGNQTLYEAHKVAEHIHDEIEKKYPKIKHVMIHINPY